MELEFVDSKVVRFGRTRLVKSEDMSESTRVLSDGRFPVKNVLGF